MAEANGKEIATTLSERAGAVALSHNTLAPKSLQEVMDFAQLMAKGGAMIGKGFRSNPGACAGIIMQSLQWNMNPYMVSQKAYVTVDKEGNEVIGYESQLVNAVIRAHAPIIGVLEYSYSGEGPERRCRISALLKGAKEPSVYESPPLRICRGRSPLWDKDADQQLGYFSSRAWARRYCPEVLMGAYAIEELQDAEVIGNEPSPANVVAIEGVVEDSVGDAFIMGEAAQLVEDHYTGQFFACDTTEQVEKIWASFERKYWKGKRRCISQNFYEGIMGLRDNRLIRVESAYATLARILRTIEETNDLAALEEWHADETTRILWAKLSEDQQRQADAAYEARQEAFAEAVHAKLAQERASV